MANRDLTSYIKKKGIGFSSISTTNQKIRSGIQRMGKVVDVETTGAWADGDTVDIGKLGLKEVYSVWQPVAFVLSDSGHVLTAPVGGFIPTSAPIRFIGR